MTTVLLVAALLAGIIVLTPLADRWRVPFPVLLTVFGLLVPLVPGVPSLRVEPDLILPLVLPPLLFAATQKATARDFRENARPILVLAVGLTTVTAGVVAVVAHAMGLGWGPAFVLGAVVSPPDPVAATAVARRLRLPGRLVTVLEGEGMFNDATALVLYKVAVGAVIAGGLSGGSLALSLVLAVVVGVGVGLAGGALAQAALARLHLPAPETTITLAMPFGVYLLADHLQGSGVLAVLVMGLYLRTFSHTALTSGGWLLGRSVWRYADYIITSLVFVFIGFELTAVLETEPLDARAVWLAAAVVGTLIAVRFGWLFPVVAASRWRHRRRPGEATPVGARETTVTAWAGMRGVVTVATALALPATVTAGDTFPDRRLIVFVGLGTVLVTLVAQGLTLAPLVRLLKVGSDVDVVRESRRLRRRATAEALEMLRSSTPDVPERVREAVIMQYRGYLAAQDALVTARHGADDDEEDPGDEQAVDDLLRRAAEVEREVVIRARRHGEVSPEAADEVLDDVESRAVRDSG
ncbi:Na+/H+ antiporter [Isoptericola sp. b441]|uniref:Na+/H+ antiporter n=1 Tax=Actinotalea lenta TaxID=3064654 RepID=A0ABT9DAD2_9CELL|nr:MULTISPECIES: Na+/H+ antiporter [unclassified Isoptericola]MDO8107867.1 Na+/H+ antiporter [Isoptericola sp. b441]MDO8120463.1 Na+/H+ antiporter [Isoptericola sp. b490]